MPCWNGSVNIARKTARGLMMFFGVMFFGMAVTAAVSAQAPAGADAPQLAFDPTSLDFGDVALGTTSPPQQATLHNTGDGDAPQITFNDIADSGFVPDVNNCDGGLGAGQSCQVTITLTPPIEAPINTTLVASEPGFPPGLLQLSGHGVAPASPAIAVDPASLSSELMQGLVEEQPLTISNVGGEDLSWYIPENLSDFGDNINALVVWDDGTGPALYAGGRAVNSEFNGIARWDGEQWMPLGAGVSGTSAQVQALTVFEGDLIAAGRFARAGGVEVNNIARWDGSQWSAMGAGTNSNVQALGEFQGALVAAGSFTEMDGQPMSRISSWDGNTWSPLGAGLNNQGRALVILDGDLIVGGMFSEAGGVAASRVARWDGNGWSALGTGVDGNVFTMALFDGAVIAAGNFTTVDGEPVNRIARWDGSQWLPLGSGVPGAVTISVQTLTVFNDTLIVGGRFTEAGGVSVANIARWDGGVWSPLGAGMNSVVNAVTVFDNALIAGGQFGETGGVPVLRIARWDDSVWSPVSAQVPLCGILPDWLEISPGNGSVAAGDEQLLILDFDATQITAGEYAAELCIINTDQDQALVQVPVTLTVTEPPVAEVMPGVLDFALVQDGSDEATLNIGNLGLAEMVWSIDGDVADDLVAFDDIDFTVPDNQWGGSVRWDTGETCNCQSAPHNFNMWRTGGTGELAFFWPGQEAAGGGGVTEDGETYALLDAGATIGWHSDFFRRSMPSATVNWRGVGEAEGYMGFRFVNPDTEMVNYGYARIAATGISGHPATIKHWVYNRAGDPVAIGGCDDPADISWLNVSQQSGTTPPESALPLDIAVNAAGLAPGTHQAQLCVATNDPRATLVAVPVILEVLENMPAAEITPDELAFEIAQGGDGSQTLDVANVGDADLVWSLETAEGARGDAIVADGGFEAGTPNPSWEEGSDNFGTPLCDADCLNGVNGARSGNWWVWFGGIGDTNESGFVAQEIVIGQTDHAELRFWLAIPDAFTTGLFQVSLGGETLFSVSDQDADDYAVYTEVVIDVSAYADGQPRELKFEGQTQAGEITNFFLDDVSVTSGVFGACDNPTDIPWLSVAPPGGTVPPEAAMPVTVTADAADLEEGMYHARLCVTTNDPAATLVEIPVALTVFEVLPNPPVLEVTPAALDFGEVLVDDQAALEFVVANAAEAGAENLELSAITLANHVFAVTGGDCTTGDLLAPGDECAVQVSFSPDAKGLFDGTVEVASADGQNAAVELSGAGIPDPGEPGDVIFRDRFEPDGPGLLPEPQ